MEVKVGNGHNAITWYLPKNLLVHHSTFICAALEGRLGEANTTTITLPTCTPHIFDYLVQWLFTGSFKIKWKCHEFQAFELVAAWILGDYLGCPRFQDCSVHQLLHRPYLISLADPGFIDTVYEGMPKSSKLRQLIVASFLFVSMDESQLTRNMTLGNNQGHLREFSEDVMNEIFVKGRGGCVDPSSNPDRFLLGIKSEDV